MTEILEDGKVSQELFPRSALQLDMQDEEQDDPAAGEKVKVPSSSSSGGSSGVIERRGKVLALIRTQYLEAKPPQQIKLLQDLFPLLLEQKQSEKSIDMDTVTVMGESSTPDQQSGRSGEEKMLVGLDGGCTNTNASTSSKTELETGASGKCSGKMGNLSNDQIGMAVIKDLFDITLGGCNAENVKEEVEEEEENGGKGSFQKLGFLHPPIQYRIQFAKYIIKKMEESQLSSCNWSSTPQGSHEKDGEDPTDDETGSLLLEKWYDALEGLTAGRKELSEPFYRLYEIKVGRHQSCNKGGGGGGGGGGGRGKGSLEMVKIFENETSFVADGTTGLVTWKASTECLKWLTSSDENEMEEGGSQIPAKRWFQGKGNVRWILELGCGCGLLAVALLKLLTLEQYIATDRSMAALEKAKLNVESNFIGDQENKRKIRFERVEWENEATRESFTQLVDGLTNIFGADQGVLLGADIVFDPAVISDLVELIVEFVEAKAGIAIIACTIRNETTMEHLKKQLDCKQLKFTVCGKWEDGEILEIRESERLY